MDKYLNDIYYGNLYLVQSLEDDYEFHTTCHDIFLDCIYIENENLLLINMGASLFYKRSENSFINLNTFDTVRSINPTNNNYFVQKESLIPYAEFKNHGKLNEQYPKDTIKKSLLKYYTKFKK